jgi:hypothetical protein
MLETAHQSNETTVAKLNAAAAAVGDDIVKSNTQLFAMHSTYCCAIPTALGSAGSHEKLLFGAMLATAPMFAA